jgi:hypothetical protein
LPLAWPVVHSAAATEETDACFIVRDGNGQALAYGAHSFGVHLHPDNAAIG